MNTDSLGGVAITTATDAAIDTSSTFVHTAKTRITAAEGQVQISKDILAKVLKTLWLIMPQELILCHLPMMVLFSG